MTTLLKYATLCAIVVYCIGINERNITFTSVRVPQCFMDMIRNVTARSRVLCMGKCQDEPRCLLVTYAADTGLCRLYKDGNTLDCSSQNDAFVTAYRKVILVNLNFQGFIFSTKCILNANSYHWLVYGF